ncbi:MAG TPA: hypothetical protein VGR57_19575 [Ktedonobacterales bacterium]|nr:hypothetical protein [Ktedonobacterales bacterium]
MLAGLKWGAISGVAVYVVALALDYLALQLSGNGATAINERPVLLIPICGAIFAILFACSAAGFFTARETGVVWQGIVAGVIAYAVQFGLSKIYTPGARSATPATPVTAVSVIVSIIAGLLVVGIAAGMGWLGGRPGALQYARRRLLADPTTPPAE